MHAPPADLSISELRTALVSGWRIETSSIGYAPVGFGSHHWTVVEAQSRRWFVTAVTETSDYRAAARVVDLIVVLHAATPVVEQIAGMDDFLLPGRWSVQRLLDSA